MSRGEGTRDRPMSGQIEHARRKPRRAPGPVVPVACLACGHAHACSHTLPDDHSIFDKPDCWTPIETESEAK